MPVVSTPVVSSQTSDAGKQTVDLSVVIVSYNTRDILDACLASLAQPDSASRRPDPELIVVDNASSDGSVAMVRSCYRRVRVIEMGENAGFARASNQGLRASSGRFVLLLNSDTVVHGGAQANMVSFMDEHPEFAAAGPLLLNSDGSVQTSCFAFTTVRDILFESLGLTALFPYSPVFNRRGMGGFDRTTVRAVDWVSGACLMARRRVIEQVGLLDEGFFMYGEELDWCYRMRQAGLRVAFFPGARVIHYGRGSSARTRGDIAPRALAGRLRYFRKHHGPGAALAVRLLTIVGAALRLLTLPLLAVVRRGDLRADFDWNVGLLRGAMSRERHG